MKKPKLYRNIEPFDDVEVGSAWELIDYEFVLLEDESITVSQDEDDKFVLDDLYFECID